MKSKTINTNSGDWNSGNRNSGNWNSGNWNSGNRNSGNRNSGNLNSGDWNSGDWNSGNWNSGNRNSGNWNSGNWNSGNRNSGNWNSGNWNSGDWNSGDWNSGDRNSGNLNSTTPDTIRIFNQECSMEVWENSNKPNWLFFQLCIDELEWVEISQMTEQQKIDNPTYGVTQGFLLLKKSDYSKDEVFKKSAQKSWENANHEDRMLTYQLPNFDAKVANEIFGIDFEGYLENQKLENSIIELNGVRYKRID